jgi:hypothetical protein
MINQYNNKEAVVGFWNTIAAGLINGAKKSLEEHNKAREKYASYTDERLLNIVRDDSTFLGPSESEKTAARSVLRDRGYDAETMRIMK